MSVIVRCAAALCALTLSLAPSVSAAQSQAVAPAEPKTLDPESPMEDLPGIGVDWPDMADSIREQSAAPASGTASNSAERRYTVALEGLEKLGATSVQDRFDALSTLKKGEGDAANTAQIDRRTREDRDLLEAVLKTAGHYDAQIETSVENGEGERLLVRFIVTPGPLYRFSSVAVTGLEETGAKAPTFGATFGVDAEDAIDADDVLGGSAALERQLKDQGYPFAKVSEPEVVVDHDTRSGALSVKVDAGGERVFGDIRISSANPPFAAKHVADIARFNKGAPYDQSMVDDLKRALIATGIVGAVDVSPVPGPGAAADIAVALEKAPLRTIAGEAGYGSGEGFRGEVSWTHRNLIRPEGAVTLRGVAGTREQLAEVSLRQSNFRKRDRTLNAALSASNIRYTAYEARTVSLSTNLERLSNIIWRKTWTWSAGVDLLLSNERDLTGVAGAARETFKIASLPLVLGYDRSNDLLDPTKGFRLGVRAAPEISFAGRGSRTYLRTQFDASAYVPASKRVTIAGRARVGSIAGASTLDIAPSRRFYAGGGGSVRGFGYQAIGPRDVLGDPMGGRSLVEFALEARVRLSDFGVVPFVDAGNIYDTRLPRLTGLRYGAGIGARYHSSFGPIRIDVGTPLNPRAGDSRITVFVSLGQAF